MVKVAFAGAFATRLVEDVRRRVTVPCEVIADDEAGILARLAEADVLVTMAFSRQMADASPHLKLVQVAGAGLDRIDRSALRPEIQLANVYGHDSGIAEYVIATMLALTRFAGLTLFPPYETKGTHMRVAANVGTNPSG